MNGDLLNVCWVCDVTPLADPLLFAEGMSVLPWEERLIKVSRFRFIEDRMRCLGAGLLAMHALRQAGADDLRLATDKNGKPGLTGCPHIQFNLSHSGKLAVCAVSDHPVGTDVEAPGRDHTGVALRCFQEDELKWLAGAEDRSRAFLRLWTRKESYIKLLGLGLSCPLKSVSVIPGGETEKEVSFSEWETEEHLICVCSSGERQFHFLRWKIDRDAIEDLLI